MKRAAVVTLLAIAVVASTPAPAAGTDVPISGEGPFQSTDGPVITYNSSGGSSLNFTELFPDNNTVRINSSEGAVTFSSSSQTTATVSEDNISDNQWTNVTGLDVTGSNLTVDADDMAQFSVGGDAGHVAVRDTLTADDGVADFRYGGQSGTTTLTLTHAPASTELGAIDAETGEILAVATSNSTGAVTFTLPNSDHTVELQTNDGPPSVDDASASPQNNETVRYQDQTLSINVDDPDFPEDTVEVDFYVNGSVVGTDTLNDAGTASVTASGMSEGTHTWHAEATDGYGETTTSKTFEFTVDHYDPVLDNQNASPQGNPTIRYDNETLALDVSDRDFAADGDELTVEFTANGTVVGTDTLQSNGTASVQIGGLDEGTHTWNATVSDEYGQTATSGTFEFTVDHYESTVSNASPTGLIDFNPDQLQVDVADRDFGVDGDQLDVTIRHDGSQVHTETLQSNGTVTASISDPGGGSHSWTVTVTDQYGQTVEKTFSYSTPANISIWNETSPTQKINSATAEVQFFGDDGTVVERSTNNGVVNLTGLPVQEGFTVVAQTDGYEQRRTYIGSVYEQEEVYLLSESISSNNVVFTLDDQTGNFPSGDTVLRIEKALTKDFNGDGSAETRWQTIAGDFFGASGDFPVVLETDTRYRTRVTGPDGNERVLGHYTVSGDAAEVLRIGQLDFGGDVSANGTLFQASTQRINDSARYVKFAYLDSADATTNLNVTITRSDNQSNVLYNQTLSGSYGRIGGTVPIPESAPDNVSYQVQWEANRNGYPDQSGEESVGTVPPVSDGWPIDDTVLEYLGFVFIVAVMGLVVIYDDRLAAIVGTILAAGLTLIGVVSIHPIAIGVGGSIALVYVAARR